MEKLLNKFKDPELGKKIIERIQSFSLGDTIVMEVCGTHTMAISQLGIRELLEGKVDLRSGPGCPVCVTACEDIDRMIEYAKLPGITVATFGDMMRVPGSSTTLMQEKAAGSDIHVVYSPLEAVRLAREFPDREIVFLGVGFETTVPVVTLALEQAVAEKLGNFSVYSCHKLTPPAVEALLQQGDVRIEGFMCPGHVSAVIGRSSWEFLGGKYEIPAVIAGFEVNDILGGLERLLSMIVSGEAKVVNAYSRAVRENGNTSARALMSKYFETVPATWRGLGELPESGLQLKQEYSQYDAQVRFPVEVPSSSPPEGCACGEVLKGKIIPPQCVLFGRACTPQNPIGPCMVSSEGACAAYYNSTGRSTKNGRK